MQNPIPKKYIELQVNRELGGIITTYFDFLKQNLKNFTNVFINYNGIFLIGLLVVSYLLVTGFIGLSDNFASEQGDKDETYLIYLVVGGILFFILFMILAMLNYGLSTAYLITYETEKGVVSDKKKVWDFLKQKIGAILLFILLLVVIYIAVSIVGVILAIIPIVGILAYYVLIFFVLAWFGVSFVCMLQENKGVTEAFGEGWNLVTKNFWKAVGVNFILGMLNSILIFVVLAIPGIVVGIYTFHVVDNEVDLASGILPTLIYTLSTCVILIILVYSQCLSQFVNAILYYSLHEKEYNTNARSKIAQIGNQE